MRQKAGKEDKFSLAKIFTNNLKVLTIYRACLRQNSVFFYTFIFDADFHMPNKIISPNVVCKDYMAYMYVSAIADPFKSIPISIDVKLFMQLRAPIE